MTKIISLESRLNQKKLEDAKVDANISKEQETNKENSIKTLVLNSDEVFCLIECLVDRLKKVPGEANSAFELFSMISTGEDSDKDKESLIQEYRDEALWILNHLDKLSKKFFGSELILDKKLTVNRKDIERYFSVLSSRSNFKTGFNEVQKNSYYVKDYDRSTRKEKTINYLFKIFRDLHLNRTGPIFNVNMNDNEHELYPVISELKRQAVDYDDVINFYYESYVKEFKSKTTFVNEGIYRLMVNGEYLGQETALYYIKHNPTIYKRLSKLQEDFTLDSPFEYWDNYDIEKQIELSENTETFPNGVGWRVSHNVLTDEERYNEDIYEDHFEFEEYQKIHTLKFLNGLEELQGLDMEILFEEDIDKMYKWVKSQAKDVAENLDFISYEFFTYEHFKKDVYIYTTLEKLIDRFMDQ